MTDRKTPTVMVITTPSMIEAMAKIIIQKASTNSEISDNVGFALGSSDAIVGEEEPAA